MEYNPFILKICKWFSKQGHEVYLLTSDSSYVFSDQKNKFQQPKSKYTIFNKISNELNIDRDLSYIGYFCRAITEAREFDPDVILYIGYFAFFNPFVANFVSKLFNIPCIGDWIGSDLLLTSNFLNKHLKKYFLKLNTLNLVQSEDMKDKVEQITDSANVAISPDKGVDLELFRGDSEKLEITDCEDEIKILYVGRLSKIKGLDYLIESFKSINEDYPNTNLEIVGDGPIKKHLEKKIDDLGISDRVNIKGYIEYEDLPKHYRSADIFVLPSLSEGLSNVLMEAIACGLPVVTTDVGGNRELIKDRRGGYLVPPKNPVSIFKAIEKLIESPELRKEMGRFNKKYVEKFKEEKILNEKLKIIENLFNNYKKTK